MLEEIICLNHGGDMTIWEVQQVPKSHCLPSSGVSRPRAHPATLSPPPKAGMCGGRRAL